MCYDTDQKHSAAAKTSTLRQGNTRDYSFEHQKLYL